VPTSWLCALKASLNPNVVAD